MDCGGIISRKSAMYGNGRCKLCADFIKKRFIFSKEHRKKLSKACKGKNHPLFGKHHSEETKLKMSKANKGKKVSKETRLKLSKIRQGKKHPNYCHGMGYAPYPLIFSIKFKLLIRQRDNFICQNCGITETEHKKNFNQSLHVHHIDYNKQNCNESNLITLCHLCNTKANGDRDYWFAYYTYKMEEK